MRRRFATTQKRALALVVIGSAIAGFVTNSELKQEYCIFEQRFTGATTAPLEVPLQTDSTYVVEIWAVDEQFGFEWANLDVTVELRDPAGQWFESRRLTGSENREGGGGKRAAAGSTVPLPPGLSSFAFTIDLAKGDYVDVEVYQDLPTWIDLAPGIYASVLFLGLVLFLKSRVRSGG